MRGLLLRKRFSLVMGIIFLTGVLSCTSIASTNTPPKQQTKQIKIVMDGRTIKLGTPLTAIKKEFLISYDDLDKILKIRYSFDKAKKTVKIASENKEIIFISDSLYATVNKKKVKLEVPAKMSGVKMLIPLAFMLKEYEFKQELSKDGTQLIITGKMVPDLQKRNVEIIMDGRAINLGTPLTAIKNEFLISYDDLGKILQISYSFDTAKGTVKMTSKNREIIFTTDSQYAMVNNKKVKLDVPAKMLGMKMLIPLGFLLKEYEFKLELGKDGTQLIITSKMVLDAQKKDEEMRKGEEGLPHGNPDRPDGNPDKSPPSDVPNSNGSSNISSDLKVKIRNIISLSGGDPDIVERASLEEIEREYPGMDQILNKQSTELTHFPIELSRLYWEDNPAAGTSKEKGFEPFSNHLNRAHIYGAGCWYMHSSRRLPIIAPADVIVTSQMNKQLNDARYKNDSSYRAVYDGVEMYLETGLYCIVSKDLYINLGHMALPKQFVDELMTKKVISIKAGETIGYVESWPGPNDFMTADFRLLDMRVDNGINIDVNSWIKHLVCPLGYFTPEMQSKIRDYYNKYTYQKFIEYGDKAESKIDSPIIIDIPGTVWGVWYHKNGLIPGVEGCSEDFPRSVLSFIHPSKWVNETFKYRLYRNKEPLPAGLSGLYGEVDASGYSEIVRYGESYLFLVEGNDEKGIFKLENTRIGKIAYMKFAVKKEGDAEANSLLSVKYYESLEAARDDNLMDRAVTYSRQWKWRMPK